MPSRTVHISEKGMRLERFMRIHFPEVPFGMLGGLLKRGKLTVDGGPADVAQTLEAGQVIAIAHRDKPGVPGPGASLAQATQKALPQADRDFLSSITLYEDDDIFVFDKPSGLAVHPGSKITRDLDSLLVRYVPHGAERPVLAHRLDKDTSGVIVAAKRKDVAQALGKAFETRDVEKEYRAVVAGVPEAGLIDIAIAKQDTPRGGRMVAVDPASPGALSAQTRVEIIAAGEARSHVALFPETGRQHQLRVHMALTGHPILGDAMYGDAGSAPRLMLHAYRLRFKHPAKGWMEVEAELPEGF
jgi:RluA family pseudouridine synthase